jgi:hypothetical protein
MAGFSNGVKEVRENVLRDETSEGEKNDQESHIEEEEVDRGNDLRRTSAKEFGISHKVEKSLITLIRGRLHR